MNHNGDQFRTEYDKDSKEFMTKTAFQQKNGWVSPFSKGDPNRTEFVSKDEQTQNMAFAARRNNYKQPWTKG